MTLRITMRERTSDSFFAVAQWALNYAVAPQQHMNNDTKIALFTVRSLIDPLEPLAVFTLEQSWRGDRITPLAEQRQVQLIFGTIDKMPLHINDAASRWSRFLLGNISVHKCFRAPDLRIKTVAHIKISQLRNGSYDESATL